MNRTLLRYFIKLYETENITRAAEELLLSRQSLSGYIAKLEKEVGTPLFTRSREGVKLTEAGKILRDFAERDEARYRESELDYTETLRKIATSVETSRVSFALPANMLTKKNIERIMMAGSGGNGYTLDMHDVPQPSWRDVRCGRYDVIMSRRLPPKSKQGLSSSLFLQQGAYILVNKESELTALDEVDFQNDLKKVTCLCMYDYLVDELELYARKQKVNLEKISHNMFIIERTVASKCDTVCLFPELTAKSFASSSSDVTYLPLVNFPISLDAYLIHRDNPPKHVERFLSDMEAAYEEVLSEPLELNAAFNSKLL